MKKLTNKIAVVTGGNSGIGFATAKLFAAEGAKVTITGRNLLTIKSAVEEIGHGAILFLCLQIYAKNISILKSV